MVSSKSSDSVAEPDLGISTLIPALVRYEVLPPVRRFTLPGLACLVREKRESANMLTPVMGVAASETGKAAICPILPSLFPVYLFYY